LKEIENLEEIGSDERNNKMALYDVAADGDSWWAFVYAVMELRIQYNAEKLLIILCLVEFLWVELSLAEEYKLKIRLFYSKTPAVFGPDYFFRKCALSKDNRVICSGHLVFIEK
jgi:hypothetical protein